MTIEETSNYIRKSSEDFELSQIKHRQHVQNAEGMSTDVTQTDRATWGNSIEFLMSCIAFSVGLGNVWRFPLTAYENGGGAFVIAYLIVLFIVGKPFYYLETALGQFTSRSCIKMWSVSPAFRGIGYGMTVAVFLVESYYAGLMALIFYYLVVSFQSPLPWTICQEQWGDECFTGNNTNTSTKSSSELFFIHTVLNENTIQNGLGLPSWQLVLCLFASWVIIFVILYKGVQSSGKASYFLALFPYVIMLVLFGRAVTLDGAVDGILYLFTPDWSRIADPAVWYAAVTQAFFSLGVCFGGVAMYASYNKFHHNVTRDCMIVSSLDLCTSLLAGATIFGILGNLSYELGNEDFNSVVRSGTGLAFISYPEALAKFIVAPSVFAVAFFLMLFVLGVGSSVALANVVISVINDQFPTIAQWKIASGVALSGFGVGIIYCTPGGQYMINLVDHFAGTFIIIFLACFEIIAVSWVYGVDNFLDDVEFMTGKRPSWFWRICWGCLTPTMLFAILFYFLFSLTPLKYNDEYYPKSAYVAGWIILAIGIFPFIILMVVTIIKNRGKKFTEIFQPSPEWGPRDLNIRKEWILFKEMKRQERLRVIESSKISRFLTVLFKKF